MTLPNCTCHTSWPTAFALVAALALLAASAGSLSAAAYHVSPTGRDRGAGSAAAPFRTIARGLAAANRPGDVVLLHGGLYRPKQTLNLVTPGTKGRFTTLRARAGEKPIVDGSDLPENANLLAVGTHHVRIEGLSVRRAKRTGIVVWGPGSRVHDVQIVGNEVHHCHGGGIYCGNRDQDDPVRDLLLEGNEVHHNVLRNAERTSRSWDFGIGGGMSSNLVMRNNVVHENHGEGIGLYLSEGGIVERNVVHDNFSVNVYLDNATRCRVDRNFVYSTRRTAYFRFGRPAPGIQIANENYPGAANPSSHNVITNNVLIDNGTAIAYGSYQRGGGLRHSLIAHNTARGSAGALLRIDVDAGHRDSRIVNNVFQQVGRVPLTDVRAEFDGIVFSHNLWHGGIPQDTARGEGDVLADPKFVDPGDVNAESLPNAKSLRIRDDSPVRGAGLAVDEVVHDFAGNRRSDPPDIGAWSRGE